MANVKLTVSIPKELYKKIESGKKKLKKNRSEYVQEAIQAYFVYEEEKAKVDRYVAGYKKHPEDKKRVEEFEKEQLKVLSGEF
ncbi:MAG: ribbon-helix-helix protein, CopG family [bacterium]